MRLFLFNKAKYNKKSQAKRENEKIIHLIAKPRPVANQNSLFDEFRTSGCFDLLYFVQSRVVCCLVITSTTNIHESHIELIRLGLKQRDGENAESEEGESCDEND